MTEKCCKWNADGTPKNNESSHKDKKAHKAFAQLKSKTEYNKKLLKKLLKKSKSSKKSKKRHTHDSSAPNKATQNSIISDTTQRNPTYYLASDKSKK